MSINAATLLIKFRLLGLQTFYHIDAVETLELTRRLTDQYPSQLNRNLRRAVQDLCGDKNRNIRMAAKFTLETVDKARPDLIPQPRHHPSSRRAKLYLA